MMELIQICDPAAEDCDTRCAGGPCGWKHCAEGDSACERAVSATKCVMNREKCPDTLLRCTRCGDDGRCPPDAHCAVEPDLDGHLRCVPGCLEDTDCGPADACGGDGRCAPAPCPGPCPPGRRCMHGTCG